MTEAIARARMREQAQKLFTDEKDMPKVEMSVEFAALGDTEEYKQFRNLENCFLFDYIQVEHPAMNINVTARITKIEWDCLLDRMESVEIGEVGKTLATTGVTSWQIPSGINGSKIESGTVDIRGLEDGSINGDMISDDSITNAHIVSVSASKITSGTLSAARLPFKVAWGTVSATSSSATTPTMDYSAAGFTSLPSVVVSFAKEGTNDAGDWGSLKVFGKTLTEAKVVIGGNQGLTKSVDWIAIGV